MEHFDEYGVSEDIRRSLFLRDPALLVTEHCEVLYDSSSVAQNEDLNNINDNNNRLLRVLDTSDEECTQYYKKILNSPIMKQNKKDTASKDSRPSTINSADDDYNCYIEALRQSVDLSAIQNSRTEDPTDLIENPAKLDFSKYHKALSESVDFARKRNLFLSTEAAVVNSHGIKGSSVLKMKYINKYMLMLRCAFTEELREDHELTAALKDFNQSSDIDSRNVVNHTTTREGLLSIGDSVDNQTSSVTANRSVDVVADTDNNRVTSVDSHLRIISLESASNYPSTSSLGNLSIEGEVKMSQFAGIVRDDCSGLRGLPKHSPHASMPYVNGILSKLIRLSELPEYLRDRRNYEDVIMVPSPGIYFFKSNLFFGVQILFFFPQGHQVKIYYYLL